MIASLPKGKKVFIVTARGGIYSDNSPAKGMDFQEPYLRTVLAFLGLTDVTFVHFEGVGMGPEAADANRTKALAAIERLTDRALADAAD